MRLKLHHADGTSEILEFGRDSEGRWVPKQDITLRVGHAFILQPLPSDPEEWNGDDDDIDDEESN